MMWTKSHETIHVKRMYRVKYAVVIAALKELRKVTRVMFKMVSRKDHSIIVLVHCFSLNVEVTNKDLMIYCHKTAFSDALMNPIAYEVMLQGLAMVEQEFLT